MGTIKPKIGEIIEDDEGNKWEVTDNVNREKFLWQTPSFLEKLNAIFLGGKSDFWIPVKPEPNLCPECKDNQGTFNLSKMIYELFSEKEFPYINLTAKQRQEIMYKVMEINKTFIQKLKEFLWGLENEYYITREIDNLAGEDLSQ